MPYQPPLPSPFKPLVGFGKPKTEDETIRDEDQSSRDKQWLDTKITEGMNAAKESTKDAYKYADRVQNPLATDLVFPFVEGMLPGASTAMKESISKKEGVSMEKMSPNNKYLAFASQFAGSVVGSYALGKAFAGYGVAASPIIAISAGKSPLIYSQVTQLASDTVYDQARASKDSSMVDRAKIFLYNTPFNIVQNAFGDLPLKEAAKASPVFLGTAWATGLLNGYNAKESFVNAAYQTIAFGGLKSVGKAVQDFTLKDLRKMALENLGFDPNVKPTLDDIEKRISEVRTFAKSFDNEQAKGQFNQIADVSSQLLIEGDPGLKNLKAELAEVASKFDGRKFVDNLKEAWTSSEVSPGIRRGHINFWSEEAETPKKKYSAKRDKDAQNILDELYMQRANELNSEYSNISHLEGIDEDIDSRLINVKQELKDIHVKEPIVDDEGPRSEEQFLKDLGSQVDDEEGLGTLENAGFDVKDPNANPPDAKYIRSPQTYIGKQSSARFFLTKDSITGDYKDKNGFDFTIKDPKYFQKNNRAQYLTPGKIITVEGKLAGSPTRYNYFEIVSQPKFGEKGEMVTKLKYIDTSKLSSLPSVIRTDQPDKGDYERITFKAPGSGEDIYVKEVFYNSAGDEVNVGEIEGGGYTNKKFVVYSQKEEGEQIQEIARFDEEPYTKMDGEEDFRRGKIEWLNDEYKTNEFIKEIDDMYFKARDKGGFREPDEIETLMKEDLNLEEEISKKKPSQLNAWMRIRGKNAQEKLVQFIDSNVKKGNIPADNVYQTKFLTNQNEILGKYFDIKHELEDMPFDPSETKYGERLMRELDENIEIVKQKIQIPIVDGDRTSNVNTFYKKINYDDTENVSNFNKEIKITKIINEAPVSDETKVALKDAIIPKTDEELDINQAIDTIKTVVQAENTIAESEKAIANAVHINTKKTPVVNPETKKVELVETFQSRDNKEIQKAIITNKPVESEDPSPILSAINVINSKKSKNIGDVTAIKEAAKITQHKSEPGDFIDDAGNRVSREPVVTQVTKEIADVYSKRNKVIIDATSRDGDYGQALKDAENERKMIRKNAFEKLSETVKSTESQYNMRVVTVENTIDYELSDGNKNSSLHKIFVSSLNEALANRCTMDKSFMTNKDIFIGNSISKYGRSPSKVFSETHVLNGIEMNGSQKLGIYLISQQEGGIEALDKRNGIKKDTVDAVVNSMSPQELDVANYMRKELSELLPALDETFTMVTGNKLRTYQNYFSMRVDPNSVPDAHKDMFHDFEAAYIHETDIRASDMSVSAVKARSSDKAVGKLDLDAESVFNKTVDNIHRYIAYGKPLHNIKTLLNDASFVNAIEASQPGFSNVLGKWYKDVAQNRDTSSASVYDKAFRQIRQNSAGVAIAGKIFTATKAALSVYNAAPLVGTKNITIGIRNILFDSAGVDKQLQFSPVIQKRVAEMDSEMADSFNKKFGAGSTFRGKGFSGSNVLDSMQITAENVYSNLPFLFFKFFDNLSVKVVYSGAFTKYLSENPGMEKAAGEYATTMVKKTQSWKEIQDLPDMLRAGETIRAFTQFKIEQQFWRYAIWKYDILEANKHKLPIERVKAVTSGLFYIFMMQGLANKAIDDTKKLTTEMVGSNDPVGVARKRAAKVFETENLSSLGVYLLDSVANTKPIIGDIGSFFVNLYGKMLEAKTKADNKPQKPMKITSGKPIKTKEPDYSKVLDWLKGDDADAAKRSLPIGYPSLAIDSTKVAYHLIAGHPFFKASTPAELMKATYDLIPYAAGTASPQVFMNLFGDNLISPEVKGDLGEIWKSIEMQFGIPGIKKKIPYKDKESRIKAIKKPKPKQSPTGY